MSLAGSTASAAVAGSSVLARRWSSGWAAWGSACAGASGGRWPGVVASIALPSHCAHARSEHCTVPVL
eukprot:7518928-Alexandrium_andersonii.AAC.1